MKKKTILTLFGVMFSFITPTVISSCSSTKNTYNFVLSSSNNDSMNPYEFGRIIETKVNEKLDGKNIKINVQIENNSDSKKNKLKNGTADFAFLPLSKVITKDKFYKNFKISIQTLTDAFKFDLDGSIVFENKFENDPLIEIAQNIQNASFKWGVDYTPFHMWNNYDWNGIRYNAFYSDKLTNHYRGMIIMCGTEQEIYEIEKVWNDPLATWDDFKKFGIIYGDKNSDGNFKLQELILKERFTINNVPPFQTLEQEILNDKNNLFEFDKYGTSKIGKTNKKIAFTDEASFAWIKNSDNSFENYTPLDKNGNFDANKKIKILTVTNPSFYDVGLFSKRVNDDLIKIFSETFIEMSKENLNSYGDGLGYNGYKIINDFDSEVLEKYQKTFGEF